MAAFGSGINPSLGATNYGGYLQGALAGAQMSAQGQAAIGQGLANLGQQLGGAIQQYYAKKEKKELENQAVSAFQNIARNNPDLAKQLGVKDPEDSALAKSLVKGLGGPAAALGIASQLQEQQQQRGAATYAGYLTQGNGVLPSPVNPRAFSPEEQLQGRTAYIENRIKEAQAKRLEAQAATGGADPTSAQMNTRAIIAAELASGVLENDPKAIKKREASLLAAGGRDPDIRFDTVGTYVRRDGQDQPVTAVKNSRTGEIGYVEDGKFTVLDPSKYQPITMGDSNAFLNETNFYKLSSEVVAQENAIKNLNRYAERVGGLNVGIQRGIDNLTRKFKTAIDAPLSKAEEGLTLAQAQQQRLLGLLRTEVLGPGVLTEFDAQRIIDATGGDVTSIFNNPEIVRQAVYDIATDKMNKYQQDLDIYNRHVAGRYGQVGYAQRKLITPNMGPKGANVSNDELINKAKAEIERRKAKSAP